MMFSPKQEIFDRKSVIARFQVMSLLLTNKLSWGIFFPLFNICDDLYITDVQNPIYRDF